MRHLQNRVWEDVDTGPSHGSTAFFFQRGMILSADAARDRQRQEPCFVSPAWSGSMWFLFSKPVGIWFIYVYIMEPEWNQNGTRSFLLHQLCRNIMEWNIYGFFLDRPVLSCWKLIGMSCCTPVKHVPKNVHVVSLLSLPWSFAFKCMTWGGKKNLV